MLKDSSKEKNRESGIENREVIPSSQFPIHSSTRKAGFGGPWRVIFTALSIFLFSQFIAVFLIGFILVLARGVASGGSEITNSVAAQFFYVLLAEGLAAGLAIWVVVKRRKLNLAAIGLGRRPQLRDGLRALAGAGVFYVLLIAASVVLTILAPNTDFNKDQNVGFNNLVSGLDQLIAFVSLVILPPLGEEILIRGYLYSGLRSTMRFIPAMLLASGLFGLAHLWSGIDGSLLWAAGIDTFLLSLVLVFLREKTGALYAGMLVHALNNIIAFSIHFR